jgi:glycosyltransferase involved in cell wall biosynthesis
LEDLRELGYVVHFAHIQQERGNDQEMRAHWGEGFHPISYTRPSVSIARRLVRKIASLILPEVAFTKTVDEWYDNRIDEALVELHQKHRFAVVIVEYVFFSKALNCFDKDVLKLIDTHDVFSNRHKLYLANNVKPTWFSTTKRQERKGLNRADTIIAIQDIEKDFLQKLCDRPVVTIGHSVNLKKLSCNAKTKTILYVGSKNPINVRSLRFFTAQVFPRIRENVPNVKLVIAGSVCEELEPSISHIETLGRVGDLESAYADAKVVVNPMLYGTGLKIKNIEALGYAKPLVTSPIGAEGLESGIDSAFLVANTVDEWVTSVTNVLTDSWLAESLEKEAYAFATAWNDKIFQKLEDIVGGNVAVLSAA